MMFQRSLDTICSSGLKIFLRHKCIGKFAIQLNNPLSVRLSNNEGGIYRYISKDSVVEN